MNDTPPMTLPLYSGEPPLFDPALSEGANADACQISVYTTAGDTPAPAFVCLAGGGYGRRSPHESHGVAQWLNTLGLAAAVCEYRVSPYRHPAPLLDAREAVRVLRARAGEWGIDGTRVGVTGFSAGGHLAATLCTQPGDDPACRPDLAMLGYPVISFVETPHAGSRRALLGEDATEEDHRALSAELRVSADTPPAFVWTTADDRVVPRNNSYLYAEALWDHGVPAALHVFPAGRHGLGLAEGQPAGRWKDLFAGWLRDQGWIA